MRGNSLNPFKKIKSFLLLFVSLTLVAVLFSIAIEKQVLPASFHFVAKQKSSFDTFSMKLLEQELSTDALSTHFLFSDPPFSQKQVEKKLPLYVGVTDDSLKQSLNHTLKTLQKTKVKEGSGDAYTKKLLHAYLVQNIALSDFPYYAEPLSANGGLHLELPLLFNAYLLEQPQDIENYLSLLASYEAWADSVVRYEMGKKDAGLFMPYQLALQVADQCIAFSKDPSFLIDSFTLRMDSLYAKGILTDEYYHLCLQKQKKLVETVVASAYEKIADSMLSLADASLPLSGLCKLPQGAAYYEALVHSLIGSEREIEELEQIFDQNFSLANQAFSQSFSRFLEQTGDASYQFSFPLTDASQMLAYLKHFCEQSYPVFPKSTQLSQTIYPVPDGLLSCTAPAFYICSPIDALEQQQIYINYDQTDDALSLFTTLAHEGYPGHLYQHVFSTLAREEQGLSPSYVLYSNPAYQEGWAVYVEFQSYELAKKLVDSDIDRYYIDAVKDDRLVQLFLYAYLDVMIHYEGIGYEKTADLLRTVGYTDSTSIQSVYAYIVSAPGNYVQYMMGYLEVLHLQEKAKEVWGTSYSEQRFAEFYLSNGPAPFQMIEEQLVP